METVKKNHGLTAFYNPIPILKEKNSKIAAKAARITKLHRKFHESKLSRKKKTMKVGPRKAPLSAWRWAET